MIGLEIFDAVILFFGYVFVATTPFICVIAYGSKYGKEMPDSHGVLGAMALLWWIVVMATLFSMHDFIFYVGVIGD